MRPDELYLHDMLQALDDLLRSAIVVSLQRIGAIADRLPESFRVAHPEEQWTTWIERGEQLRVRYYDIDWDDVRRAASIDVPRLRAFASQILDVELPIGSAR